MTDEYVTCPTLEDLIPDGNWRDDEASLGHLDAFINQVLQPVLDLCCDEANRWVKQGDVDQADADSVDAMLLDLGSLFDSALDLSLERKRRLVKSLIECWKTAGTVNCLKAIVRALTGIEVVSIITPARIVFWELGTHILGDTAADDPPLSDIDTDFAYLGPAPSFLPYSFQIEVGTALTDDQRSVIDAAVRIVKPAHTHYLGIVEPGEVTTPDHWELNSSDLDDDTDLH